MIIELFSRLPNPYLVPEQRHWPNEPVRALPPPVAIGCSGRGPSTERELANRGFRQHRRARRLNPFLTPPDCGANISLPSSHPFGNLRPQNFVDPDDASSESSFPRHRKAARSSRARQSAEKTPSKPWPRFIFAGWCSPPRRLIIFRARRNWIVRTIFASVEETPLPRYRTSQKQTAATLPDGHEYFCAQPPDDHHPTTRRRNRSRRCW